MIAQAEIILDLFLKGVTLLDPIFDEIEIHFSYLEDGNKCGQTERLP